MLSAELNSKIVKLAPKFQALDIAPDTFEKLKAQSLGSLVVWAGASSQTIYGDAHVNHAFRAWHDSLHLRLNAPLTFDGEKQVAIEQARIVGGAYGEIILAEVVGQAEHFYEFGEFPRDQESFVIGYLKGKL